MSSDVIKTTVFYTQSGRHLPKTHAIRSFFIILSRERSACVLIHMVDLHDVYGRFFCKWAFGLDEITTFVWCFSHVTCLCFLKNIKISISLGSGAHFQTNARLLVRYYRPLQPVGSSKSSAQYYRPISFNESVSAPCVSHCKRSLSYTSTTDESSCNSCFHHKTSSSSLN